MRALFIGVCLVLAAPSFADRLQGHVLTDQDFVGGAIVKIESLGVETTTRSDGRFVFSNVPSGQHMVTVSYLGYEQQTTQADTGRNNEIVLAQTIEEIVVYGQASSTASALNQQRAQDNIGSVVTSDEFGQLPDANLSEALQRVPGVFLERDQGEGRFVGIRGIDPGLNVTSINGITVPSPESGTRAVALDVIPSELLETLEVNKSFTPDMDPDGIGGSVNVKSLSGFDRKGQSLKIKAEASRNELEDETSPKISATYTNTYDLGSGTDNFAIAAAVSWFDRDFGSDNVETDGGWPLDLETVDEVEFRGAEEIEQRNYVINRERFGAALNLDFRPSDTTELFIRTLYSEFEDQEFRTREQFKFDDGDAVVGTATSATWDDATLERELKDRFESQEILTIAAGGQSINNAWTFDYVFGYSKSEEAEPDRLDTNFVIEGVQLGYSGIGDTPNLFADPATLDPENYELDEIVWEDNFTEDEQTSFALDLTREIAGDNYSGYVKFGGKIKRREKSNDLEAVVYDGFPGDPTLAPFTASIDYDIGNFGPGISDNAVNAYFRANQAALEVDADDTLVDSLGGDYDLDEDVNAFYIMSRMDFGQLRLVYGLRWEETDYESSGQRIVIDDVAGDGSPVAQRVMFEDDYDYVLPSINLRYAFSDDLILRAAYYETFARPSFDDLAPGGEIEFEEDDGETEFSAEIGNPLLEPLEAKSFDISLEWYDQGIGLLAAGIFYKDLENFIVLADTADQTDLTQFVGTTPIDDAEVIQPINGDNADLLGVELTWVKKFTYLPGPWSGLLLSANATFTDSEADLALRPSSIDLPRQSDRVFNITVGYETEHFSARLAGTYKSEALLGLEAPDDPRFDVYQDEHFQMDLSLKYHVNESWQIYLDANNLTDEPFYTFFDRSRYNGQYEEYGRTFALGVQYRAN